MQSVYAASLKTRYLLTLIELNFLNVKLDFCLFAIQLNWSDFNRWKAKVELKSVFNGKYLAYAWFIKGLKVLHVQDFLLL